MNDGRSSIDAKTTHLSLILGILMIFIGIAVFFYAIYSIVMWGLGENAPFGLFGSILVMMLGCGIITIGSMIAFVGVLSRLSGRRKGRTPY